MHNFTPQTSFIGGVLIGLSVLLFFYTTGRLAGVSGIFANAFIFRPWLKGIIYMSVFSVVSLVILFFFHKLQCWLGSSQREEH